MKIHKQILVFGIFANSLICTSQTLEAIIEDYAITNTAITESSISPNEDLLINNGIIDLNNANFLELTLITPLSEEQIGALIKHRNTYGQIEDIEELLVLEGFTVSLIKEISEYVYISQDSRWKNYNSIDKSHQTEIRIRSTRILEKSRAYVIEENKRGSHYLGSANSLYLNVRHQYLDRISFGFTAEKDAGEELFTGTQKRGFDFYSSYVALKVNDKLKKVIIGDYQVHFGQGLCFSTFSLSGKTSDVLLVERNINSVKPSNSVNEFNFLRGIASVCEFGPMTISSFYSNRTFDASINEEAINEAVSIQRSGLHRNESEIANKNTISSQVMGLDLSGDFKIFRPGFTVFKQFYSNPVRGNSPSFISGRNSIEALLNASFHYSSDLRNFHFYGEYARSISNGFATINGLIINIDPRLNLNITHRNFNGNYQHSFTSAFSENTGISNEKGLFTSLNFKPTRSISISYYTDYFRSPWLRHNVNAPSSGIDHFFETTYRIKKVMKFNLRLRYKEKQMNFTQDEYAIYKLIKTSKKQVRFQFSHQITKKVRFRSRLEKVFISTGSNMDEGFMTFQELKFKSLNSPISILLRYSVFDTDNYSSRIYAFEQDLPGSYSVPSMYGNGSRYMLLLSYKMSRELQFYLRFSQSIFEGQDYIGNSWNRINGQVKSELKLMCKIRI